MARLDEIFDLQMGKTPSRNNADYWTDGQYDWVSIADLGSYQKYVEDTKERISALAVQESGIKSVPANTVIMSFKLSLGKTAITQEPVYTNEAIMAFIPTEKYAVLPDYFYYLFSAKDWTKGTNRAVMGTTLNKATLGAVSITVPPIDEQRKIAAILDKVSDLIAKRRQQLDKLDEMVKARFVEIFGEPDENPKHWQEDELSHHLKVIGGYAFKSDGFTDEGIPVLRIGNINSGHFLPVNMVYWPDDLALARYKVFPGDLVMSLTGTVGKDDYGNVCILGADYDEYYLNQRNAKLSIERSLNKCYFSELLKFPRIKKRLTGISRGIRQANISNKDILTLRVPMPPIELQEQFAAFVEQTEKTKIIISHSLEKLETLKKALMQEYFG
ncbi:MAG: restriction endonuclease subunit S [Faecalibacterium sp.]